jgi:hypothetical protein
MFFVINLPFVFNNSSGSSFIFNISSWVTAPVRTSKSALVQGKSRALSRKWNSIVLSDGELGSDGAFASRKGRAESSMIGSQAGQSELIC